MRLLKKYDCVAGTIVRGDEYGMATGDEDKAKAETEVIEDYALSKDTRQLIEHQYLSCKL